MNPPQQGIKGVEELARAVAEEFYNPHHAPYESRESAKISLTNFIAAAVKNNFASIEQENQRLREALLPFKQMADKFDDPRYKDQWPDETRLSGDGIGVLKNNTIQLHNFLTLGDCRKAKQALATDKTKETK